MYACLMVSWIGFRFSYFESIARCKPSALHAAPACYLVQQPGACMYAVALAQGCSACKLHDSHWRVAAYETHEPTAVHAAVSDCTVG